MTHTTDATRALDPVAVRSDEREARWWLGSLAGGFEDLVREMSERALSRTLPPPAEEAPDWGQVTAVARAHGCELLG